MNFTNILISKISIFSPKVNKLLSNYKIYNFSVRVLNKVGIYKLLIRILLRFGGNPIVIANMKDNTKILVDLRSSTEYHSFFSGEYDSDLLDILHNLLDPNEYFLDIGANIGFYSISIGEKLKNNGTGKVISFEPLENNFNRLTDNLKLNNLEKYCYANKFGLSDNSVVSTITLREDFTNGSQTGNASISINENMDFGFEKVPIKLEKLDDFWDKFNARSEKIGLVKIDIEGHEDFCLRGGLKTINEHRPTMLMEINKPYFSARGVKLDETFLPLIPENYIIFSSRNKKWKQIHSLQNCLIIDNVFLIPKEKLSLDKYKLFNLNYYN